MNNMDNYQKELEEIKNEVNLFSEKFEFLEIDY